MDGGFNSRIERTGEYISDLKDKTTEIAQYKQQKGKR